MLEFESQLQLFGLLGFTVDVRASALDTFFPPVSIDTIEAFVLATRSTFLTMQSLLSIEAEARELSKHARRQSPHVSMRRRLDLDTLGSSENAAEVIAKAGLSSTVDSGLLINLAENAVNALRSSGTMRGALEQTLGLSTLECRDRIADEDLTEVGAFYSTAAEQVEIVARRSQRDQESVLAAVTHLNPYASPGFALRLAVNRARRNRPEAEHPSNDVDSSHAAFAPYVDHIAVDKRTHGFILQEKRDRPERLPPTAGDNVIRAGDLKSLFQTIGISLPEA